MKKQQDQDLYIPFFVIIQGIITVVPSGTTPLLAFWALGLGSLLFEKGLGLLFEGRPSVVKWGGLAGHVMLQIEAWMYIYDFFSGNLSTLDLRGGAVVLVFWMSLMGGAAFIGRFFQRPASEDFLTKLWMGAILVAVIAVIGVLLTAVIGGGVFSAPISVLGPIVMTCGMVCVLSLLTAGIARGMTPG